MEGLTLSALLLLITWLLFKLFKSSISTGKTILGPKGYPLVGCGLELTPGNIFDKFYTFAEEYGEIYQLRIFRSSNVILNSQELIHKAFCGEKYKTFLNNRPYFFFGERFYTKGHTIVFYTDPNEHAHGDMRKALARSLHVYGDGIPRFEENMNAEIQRLVNEIEDFHGDEFDIVEVLRESLTNLISILLIGEGTVKEDMVVLWELIQSQDVFAGAVSAAILSTFPFLVRLPGYYKTKFDNALVAREKFLDKYFRQMKATWKPGTYRGTVDWYLTQQQKELDEDIEPFMTDARIKDLLVEILITGTVTTWSTLSSVMLCLVNYTTYQKEIQEEVDTIKEPLSLPDRHLLRCPITEAFILESERYLTPAPLIGPHVCAEDIDFEGYLVKKGTTFLPNAWYIHHNEKIWGDPWVFRPERFLDDHGDILPNTHLFRKSLIPFGMGRRRCPGESLAQSRIFMYVGSLLKTFDFIPSESRCGPCDPRTGQFERNFLLRPKPFYCRVVKRNTNSF